MDNIKFASIEVTDDRLIDVVTKVMHSGKFIQGQRVLDFEEKWADLCNAKYCISTSSGTMALFSVMRTMRTLDGIADKERPLIILPGLSYAATMHAVHEAGFDVVYCDVDKTGLIDMKRCSDMIKKYDGSHDLYIMPVHLYGQLVNLNHKSLKNVTVIEDAAQAHGIFDEVNGDAACFSFYPSKNLGGMGNGGAIVTDNEAICTIARLYGNLGDPFTGKYEHILPGLNLRMDTIQATFLYEKLAMGLLANELESRKMQAEIYKDHKIETIATTQPNGYHLYPVLFDNPVRTIKLFREHNIDVGRHYPYILPELNKVGVDLPNSIFIARHNVTLPLGSHLTESQIGHVCETILSSFELDDYGKLWVQKTN